MTITEVYDFVNNYVNRLSMPGLGYQVETSQSTQSVEVSFYLTGELQHVFVIDTDKICVVYNGQYEKLEEQNYKTKLELFCYLTQLLLGIYEDYTFPDLLSIILTRKIRTWREYVVALFQGQPVEINREYDSLVIQGNNRHVIKVVDNKVEYYSVVLAEADYDDFSELLIALTTFIGFIMTNEGLDLTLFDTIDDVMGQQNVTEDEVDAVGGDAPVIDAEFNNEYVGDEGAGEADDSDLQVEEASDDFSESAEESAI